MHVGNAGSETCIKYQNTNSERESEEGGLDLGSLP